MARINRKEVTIVSNNSIKKSNKFSMAKLNQGLSLNQMQLLAYAIYRTQSDGKTVFKKKEFQDKFGLEYYHTNDAFKDSDRLTSLKFSVDDLENDKFGFTPIFADLQYVKGTFYIEWNHKFLPHILELKEKFVVTDLTITSNFRSSFSWILYDFLKANYGYWHKKMSKEALMNLFAVEDKKTYQNNTNRFKKSVLDVAVREINEFTEIEVWYKEIKTGNKITGFILYWSTGKQKLSATEKQLNLLKQIKIEVQKNSLDYITIENEDDLNLARSYLKSFNDLYKNMEVDLTSESADKYIKEATMYYEMLENLLEKDGKKRDTSIYYNWLEE